MKYLGRFFRYIFWLVFTAGIAWLVKKAFERAAAQAQTHGARERECLDTQPAPKALFRDPVCGTYIAEDISYCYQQGSETLHFCSRDCLDHYHRDLHPDDDRAANRLAAGA